MIDIQQVIHHHNLLIDAFGGSYGVRDRDLLESSLAIPFVTFDQQELYPDAISKASAVLESLLINHPFVDGNKRTGYLLMRLILLEEGLDIFASQHEKYEFVIKVAEGSFNFEKIKEWIANKIVTL